MRKNLYLFSGLGADERVFANLSLTGLNAIHIKWPLVTPQTRKAEFIAAIQAQIKSRKNNMYLGVSFGGIVAQDLAALLPPEKLILVSSVETEAELPSIIKRWDGLLKIVPDWFLNKPNPFINYLFSVKTEEGRNALKAIIRDTSPAFVRWAVKYMSQWTTKSWLRKYPIYRIHGAADRIFPLKKMYGKSYVIPGSGHFSIFENAAEVSECIEEVATE